MKKLFFFFPTCFLIGLIYFFGPLDSGFALGAPTENNIYYVSSLSVSTNWTAARDVNTPCAPATALANAAAGDTVYFRGGVYGTPSSRVDYQPSNSGSAGSPITFEAYPGETPTIIGGFSVTNKNWISFSGFNMQGSHPPPVNWVDMPDTVIDDSSININPSESWSTRQAKVNQKYATWRNWMNNFETNWDRGFSISASDNIVIVDNDIYYYAYGIYVVNDSKNVTMENNGIHHCLGGILWWPANYWTNLSIENSIISDNHVYQNIYGGIEVGFGAKNVLVENNLAEYNAIYGIGSGYNSQNVTIRGNIARHNGYYSETMSAPGSSAFALGFGAEGLIMENNIAADQVDPTGVDGNGIIDDTNTGTSSGAVLVRNNLCYNNHRGILIYQSSDATVINNTAVNNSNGGIDLGVSSNDVVANNILYNNKVYGLKLRNAQALVDNNLYYSVTSSLPLAIDSGQSYLTLAALRAGTGRELHGLNADPGFVDPANNDYRLTWNSPAIAAATTTYAHASDYANGNVYGIPNIGAYEFQPPSSMGIDKVDIGAGAKIFGDGKFENAAAPNSNLADLSIAPPAGFSTYASTSTVPEWLDISNITVWNKAGDYHKRWTESSAVIGSASTVHTIGDLAPNTNYLVKVDNATTTISCPRGICRSNAQGKITFTYTGGYSTHDFDISEGDNTAPTVDTYSVGGAISGLSGSVVLQNNGKDNLTVSANGSFAFAIATTTGSAYSVSVLTNPSGQTCSVSSGSGTVASANVTTVSVSCANNSTPSSGGGGGGGIAADTTPPGIPANFSVISSSGQIILSWTNPADSDFAGAKLYRKINSAPTSQADPLAKLIYQGNGNIFTDTSAMPDALYYYSLYAYDTDGNYSSPAAIYVRVASGQISTSTVPVTIPVAKNQSDNSSPIASLIGASGALVNQVTAGETATLFANAQFVPLSEIEKQTYLKIIALAAKPLTQKIKYAIADFIHSGTPTTKILGAGERGGSIASFNSAFSRLPETATDWQDIIKIGNGRWTSQTSASSLARAKINFKLVYGRNPKMSDVHDNAAVTIMAYGLRPAQRNQASEKTAIKSFKFIFHKAPVSATDWDIVRAIAYSGAKR